MAPLTQLRIQRTVIFLCLLISLLALFASFTSSSEQQPQSRPNNRFLSTRRLLLEEEVDEEPQEDLESQSIKKKIIYDSSSLSSGSSSSTTGSKNNIKLIKPDSTKSKTTDSITTTKSSKTTSSDSKVVKDETKLIKPTSSSAKNKTKSFKSGSELSYTSETEKNGPTQLEKSNLEKTKKKLNSTTFGKAESSDSLKASSDSTIKKSSDPIKSSSTSKKSKTSKSSSSADKETQSTSENPKKKKKEGSDVDKQSPPKKKKTDSNSDQTKKTTQTPTTTSTSTKKQQKTTTKQPNSWSYITSSGDEDSDDLVSEFTDLPTKFHDTFVPDLQRISTTSKIYLTKSHTQFTKGYIKPYVGHKYAPAVATTISCIFILIPLLLVSLLFNRIKAYFSLQKLLIFVQVYLSIYFTILCLSSLVTGLEPLRFFYATSPATYIWLQALQSLGYAVYLLLLLMYLVLVFSTKSGVSLKFLGLAQTVVGFAVGLHYYVAVVHRMVLRQPPKTNWKVHGIYAACFLVICIGTRAEQRRKKAYLVEDGEEGKTS